MPCNSDYMMPERDELVYGRLLALLEEARTGKHIDPTSREWQGYHPKAYGKNPTKDQCDAATAELCAYCSGHHLVGHSLEMQMWWRDHQIADQKRLEKTPRPHRPGLDASDAAIKAASEVFRLAFPDAHETTTDERLRLVMSLILECGLRKGEGCAELIEFVANLKH